MISSIGTTKTWKCGSCLYLILMDEPNRHFSWTKKNWMASYIHARMHVNMCTYIYINIYLYLYLDLDPYLFIYLDLGFLEIWKLSLSYLLKVSCLLPIRHRLKVCKLFTFKEMQVMVMNIFPKHFLCKFTLFKQSCRFPLFTMSRLPYVRANAGLVSKNLPVCIKIVIPVKY